jgi:hypothetical protein
MLSGTSVPPPQLDEFFWRHRFKRQAARLSSHADLLRQAANKQYYFAVSLPYRLPQEHGAPTGIAWAGPMEHGTLQTASSPFQPAPA